MFLNPTHTINNNNNKNCLKKSTYLKHAPSGLVVSPSTTRGGWGGGLIKSFPLEMQICSRIMIGGLILSMQRVNNSSYVQRALVSRLGTPFRAEQNTLNM